MRPVAQKFRGPSALPTVEAATQLLREIPLGTLLTYHVGSVPAVVGFLYFFADVSSGALAREHLGQSAFSATLLYLWMKCWHSVFLEKLFSHLSGKTGEPWTSRRVVRLILTQTALQPLGLLARPLAGLIVLPYLWVYLFFQNVSLYGDGREPSLRAVMRQAAGQARLWPREGHLTFLILFAFGLFVWINAAILIVLVPTLLKMFLGVQTEFSRSGFLLFANSTFLASSFGLTYLCFDPFRKAAVALRCFSGEAVHTAADLRVQLAQITARLASEEKINGSRGFPAALLAGTKTRAVSLFLVLFFVVAQLRADTGPLARESGAAKTSAISPKDLSASLEEVLQRREYTWRLPRESRETSEAPSEDSWLGKTLASMAKFLSRILAACWEFLVRIYRWVQELFLPTASPEPSSAHPSTWLAQARGTLIVLGVAVAVLLTLIFLRRGKKRAPAALAQVRSAAPDLTQEHVTADLLPEDGWLQLARKLWQSGELRLALRASYLATLAHLGAQNRIQLARHKSNRDYDRELHRRARTETDLLSAFHENLTVFERAWYGDAPVTAETLGAFTENLERIRAR